MDLFLMILRFLFGMPADAELVEPIMAHADGRTSGGRRWFAAPRSMQNIMGTSTPRQRFMYSEPEASGLWERLSYFWRKQPRLRSRRQDNCRSSRN